MEDFRRVIVLVDMDCFYVQVEQRADPSLRGKPVAVVQYNQLKNGLIIAVGYEARAFGVKRGMRGEEAQEKCPGLAVVKVASRREKADLSKYRAASDEVFRVLTEFGELNDVVVERASVDEAYLDVTEAVNAASTADFNISEADLGPSYLAIGDQTLGDWLQNCRQDENDRRLAIGAKLAHQIRQCIQERTSFHCSAGIGHNKMLAKLVCGLNKPSKQTIVSQRFVPALFETIKIGDVRNLGGKTGRRVCQKFSIETMNQLAQLSVDQLTGAFSSGTAEWLHQLSTGLDFEEVTPRSVAKSIGCGKNFLGKASLRTKDEVRKWLTLLSDELEERLLDDQRENQRTAHTFCTSLRSEGAAASVSRQCPLRRYDGEWMAQEAFRLLSEFDTAGRQAAWRPAVLNLSLSVGKFEDYVGAVTKPITNYFKPCNDAKSLDGGTMNDKSPATSPVTKKMASPSTKSKRVKHTSDKSDVAVCKIDQFFNKSNHLDLHNGNSNDSSDIDIICTDIVTTNDWLTDESSRDSVDSCAGVVAGPSASNETPTRDASGRGFLGRRLCCKQSDSDKVLENIPEEQLIEVDRFAVSEKPREQPNAAVTTVVVTPDAEPQRSSPNFLPSQMSKVDCETWSCLPPDIRWELKQHFKRQNEQREAESGNSDILPEPVVVAEKKTKRVKTIKSSNNVNDNPRTACRSLTTYFSNK